MTEQTKVNKIIFLIYLKTYTFLVPREMMKTKDIIISILNILVKGYIIIFPCPHLSRGHYIRKQNVRVVCNDCRKFLGKMHREDLQINISIKKNLNL